MALGLLRTTHGSHCSSLSHARDVHGVHGSLVWGPPSAPPSAASTPPERHAHHHGNRHHHDATPPAKHGDAHSPASPPRLLPRYVCPLQARLGGGS